MATIIRLADASHDPRGTTLNFDDFGAQAERCLADARAEAQRIVAEARQQADAIRQQAAEEGCQIAMRTVEQMVSDQWTPTIDAVRQATAELRSQKQSWLAHWESNAVRLAAAIAARIVRGELGRRPEISLRLVREALELAAGSPAIKLRLNPDDHQTLGPEIRTLIDAMSSLGGAEVVADVAVSRGGCRVETRFGAIDQQIESQLRRIEEELTA